jgi:DUF1365 family protein
MSGTALHSCLYEGQVRHRRREPRRDFHHRIAMAYVDLEELPRLLGGSLLRRWPGPARFRRKDYHGSPELPLDESVRETVRVQTGRRPTGPIRVLTNLRSYGHCFNPISLYYCFDGHDRELEAVLAEVTNTPWGERHAYVIPGGVGHFEKAMHVSPFMGMDHTYMAVTEMPGRELRVVIENRHGGEPVFEASLALERRELTPASMRRLALRYPLASIRVLALIYGHAVGLRLAGVPVFAHQERRHG